MAHKSNEPDPNRRQTRSKNASTHPGNIIIKASGRRSKEEVEEEKRAKEERRQIRETKKANEKDSVMEIAKYENRMMTKDAMEDHEFPRRRSTGMHSSNVMLYR